MDDIATGVIARWQNPNALAKLLESWDGDVTEPVAEWISTLSPAHRAKLLEGRVITDEARSVLEANYCWEALLAVGDDFHELTDKMIASGNPVSWPAALLSLRIDHLDAVAVKAIDGLLAGNGGRIDHSTTRSMQSGWTRVGEHASNPDLSVESRRALLRVASVTIVSEALLDSKLTGDELRDLVKASEAENWVASPVEVARTVSSSHRSHEVTVEAMRLADVVLDNIDYAAGLSNWRGSWVLERVVNRVAAVCGEDINSWNVAHSLLQGTFEGTLADLEAAITAVTAA